MKNYFDIKNYNSDIIFYSILFIVALGIRLFFFYAIDSRICFEKYPAFAETLIYGGDIGDRYIDLSPFYLSFTTFIMKHFTFNREHIKFIQLTLGVITCLLIYATGKHLFNRTIAFTGALIYTVYGNIIILETTLEPLVFVLFFNLLSVYFLICNSEKAGLNFFYVAISGFFCGLSIITKPNYLLFIPVAIIWLLFFDRAYNTYLKRTLLSALFFLIAASVVLPITYRNFKQFNDVVLVTADFGKVLFQGNGRNANGLFRANMTYLMKNEAFFADIVKNFNDENSTEFILPTLKKKDIIPDKKNAKEPDPLHKVYRDIASKIVGKKLTHSEASKFWAKVAIHSILKWPKEYLRLEVRKFFLFFHNFEIHLIGSSHWEYKKSLSYPFLQYGVILVLGFLGMILCLRKFNTYFLVYSVFFLYLVSALMLCVTSRYRSPAVPYLCLFAGYAIYAMYEFYIKRKIRNFVICLICLGVLTAGTHLPYKRDIAVYDQSFLKGFMKQNKPPYEKFW